MSDSPHVDAQGRPEPAYVADERATLTGFLDFLRGTIRWKAEGLTDLDARRALLTSPLMTMAGLVKHLIGVERYWFHHVLGARDDLELGDDPDDAWRIAPADTVATLLEEYEAACAESRLVVAGVSMDTVSRRQDGLEISTRWILTHMIEETGRHAGHADLLREMLDGATGE